MGDDPDRAVLERDHVDRMSIGSDSIEAEDVARHVEARHLAAAILQKDGALEEAGVHCVEGIERASGTEQALRALHGLAGVPPLVDQAGVWGVKSEQPGGTMTGGEGGGHCSAPLN